MYVTWSNTYHPEKEIGRAAIWRCQKIKKSYGYEYLSNIEENNLAGNNKDDIAPN